MKKILLTGGKGFFCTRLKEYYENKYEIISFGKEELNVTNYEEVLNTLKEYKPDYVLHAAAIAVTEFCNKHPELAHKVNVEGSVNVAKACKNTGAKLVFISSEQIFNGNKESGPYEEEHKAIPDTVYGQNKLEAEGLLKYVLEELWIVRFTWMFGLPKKDYGITSNIMWDTVSSILKNKSIKAPANEFRGITYVNEMVENFEKVFQLPYGIYHLGSKNDLSRYEIVKVIFEKLGYSNKLNELLEADFEKYKENPRDIRLNTDKAAKYGINFSTSKDAVKKCIREEVKNDIEKFRSMI